MHAFRLLIQIISFQISESELEFVYLQTDGQSIREVHIKYSILIKPVRQTDRLTDRQTDSDKKFNSNEVQHA